MTLLDKIAAKEFTLTVVGLGYVGLPLALLAASRGIRVTGLDISESRVAQLNAADSYIDDISDAELKEAIDTGLISFTTDASCVADSQVIAICVPTPLDEHKQPNISYVRAATSSVGEHLTPDSLVVLESTTYPGTTDEIVAPLLVEKSGLTLGKDLFVAFAPERVDPGNTKFEFHQVPKVVGGLDQAHTDVAVGFYKHLLDHVHAVSSTRVAEMTKLLENIYRLVNISMVNELALLSGKMNIDIWEVIDAAKTKPYGFQAFYPGPGAGGHCIPLDPFYLSWKAKEYDFEARFIALAGDVNYRMPEYALSKIQFALNQEKKPLNGSKVLVLGVAYKKDIGDYRESPMLRLLQLLQKKHADVSFYDPHVQELAFDHHGKDVMTGLADLPAFGDYDCVVIGAAHTAFDYDQIVRESALVVDLRNAIADRSHKHVYRF